MSYAADSLLRDGMRPTIEKVRAKIGKGSPNTINPMLDAWWRTLSARLGAGPTALHRLPESVAHVAEALWMRALDEGRRRAQLELKSAQRTAADEQQTLAVRSHVLSLREGELDSRLKDRERTITDLQFQVRELTLLLRKKHATGAAQTRRINLLEEQLLARIQTAGRAAKPKTPAKAKTSKRRQGGARQLRRSSTTKARRKSTAGKRLR